MRFLLKLIRKETEKELFPWNNICIIIVCKRHIMHLCIICIDIKSRNISSFMLREVNLWEFSREEFKSFLASESNRKCFLFPKQTSINLHWVPDSKFSQTIPLWKLQHWAFTASSLRQRVVQCKTFPIFASRSIDIHFEIIIIII